MYTFIYSANAFACMPLKNRNFSGKKNLIGHYLILSRRRSPSYINQSIDLLCKSMGWFLCNRDLRHGRLKLGIFSGNYLGMLGRKAVLNNSAKFKVKTPTLESLFNNVAVLKPVTLRKKNSIAGAFM